jgi:addiction module RelE/StbE family toxin
MFSRSSQFKKDYRKLSNKLKDKVDERLRIFVADEFDPILNNHKLHYEYKGYHSINITGDWRLVYRKRDEQNYLLIRIGTHSQLFDK